jgi:hypothetical protein
MLKLTDLRRRQIAPFVQDVARGLQCSQKLAVNSNASLSKSRHYADWLAARTILSSGSVGTITRRGGDVATRPTRSMGSTKSEKPG